MSHMETTKAVFEEELTVETKSILRKVKAATRRRYTPEERIRKAFENVTPTDVLWGRREMY